MQRSRRLALVAVLTLVLVPAAARPKAGEDGSAGARKTASDVYIVRMLESPVVAYEGDVAGLRATKPRRGEKINPKHPDVVRYVRHLDARHDAVVGRAGGAKVYDYRYALNGFAARLTKAQLDTVRAEPGVLSVEKAVEVTADTATTPAFLGLTDPATGLWNSHGYLGEDIIIGVLDSGVWPESLSFSDRIGVGPNGQEGKLGYQQIPGWHGKCVPGEGFNASHCNQKLIGAQYFFEGRGISTVLPHEFLSPRDFNGHGTHTASTAGGNAGVPTNGAAVVFGAVNGIAPRARIAAYKVCWDNGAGGCGANTADSVAAIDQAVADGVDVINYSISGTQTNYLDAVEVAYLFAADAGVFVATSAGNSGPTAQTVAHISPWLASVAAGTHDRSGSATVTLGSGATFTGASLTLAAGPAPLVLSTSVGRSGVPANDVRLCFLGSLDPAKVAGNIVVCDRGVNARVEKSQAVRDASGVGMILANVSATESLNADLHFLPTVHVDATAGAAIKAYVAAEGVSASAALSQGVVNAEAPAPDVAAFSSRGPSRAGGGDILKPDFMLPGQDILAAVAPPGNGGKDFDLYSGTSMSSPHAAGVAALLKEAHPDWSPAAIRSAMATTASPFLVGPYSPFGAGSGHVAPNGAIDPGLVYDAGFGDYLSFLKGQGLITNDVPPLDASDLNQPSIAIGDLAGVQTVRRRVRNVSNTTSTYTAAIAPPAGFTVSVEPQSLVVAPGETRTFTATITRTTGPLNTYRFGSLTWNDGLHAVRSPIVVRAVGIAAPAAISAVGAGPASFGIKTGYAGPLAYAVRGLVPATATAATVVDDPTDNFDTANPDANQGITTHDVVVPAGSTYLRASLFDEETDGADDLDLYVYRLEADGTKTLVALSGGGTSAEEANLVNPPAAVYRVYVHGWQTDGPSANYTLFTWVLGSADAGNLAVTGPSTATIGGAATVNLSWTGLAPGTKYFGAILFRENATTHATTLVRIDP
jgi:subtilisin family serine protease